MLNENDECTFQFRRYREEVIRRRNCRTSCSQAQQINDPDEIKIEETIVKHNKYDDDDNMGGTVIQNLSDISIIIDRNGKVIIDNIKCSRSTGFEDNDDNSGGDDDDYLCDDDDVKTIKRQQAQQQQPVSVPTGTTLLLRNLRNCIVIM